MTMQEDPRLEEARLMPLDEVASRFGVEGLRRAGGELVGPCPVCGGTDRFSINVRAGVYNCRTCGGGDGISLAGLILGLDFKGALVALCGERPTEIDPAERARRRRAFEDQEKKRAADAEKYRKDAISAAHKIWRATTDGAGTVAEAYLRGRGISFDAWPRSLRFAPALPYWRKIGGVGREWHRGPAMVAAIQDETDRLCAVHMTWVDLDAPKGKAVILGPDDKPQPAKLMRGSKRGGAIRLTEYRRAPTLITGEGIETTASVMVSGVDPDAAYWCTADLGNIAGKMVRSDVRGVPSGIPDLSDDRAFIPPAWVKRYVLLEDGDSEPVATRAKLECGARRAYAARPGISCSIVSAGRGNDFNDILTGTLARDDQEKDSEGQGNE